jgi:hypothetical protein
MGLTNIAKQLSLMTVALAMISACSQSRYGMGGRYETVYDLNPVRLCDNVATGVPMACFDFTVNVNDNIAYLDTKDIRQDVYNRQLRIGGRAMGSGDEPFQILMGDQVSGNTFIPIIGSYIVVAPSSGRHITEYAEIFVETITVQNTGPGLVPQQVPVGRGMKVVHSFVNYPDLAAVYEALGWRAPY